MRWTTIWSHAQRGIAQHSISEGNVKLTLRQIASVEKIRLVFANEYGNQTQQIQKLTVTTAGQSRQLADFSLGPNKIVKTPAISIDSEAKKWQIAFEISAIESGFAFNDADVFAEDRTVDFCSGLLAIEAEIDGECLIALGDSLTEGATWTAPLQRKLRKHKLFLVNQGINGSCLLQAGSDQPASKKQDYFYGYDGAKRLKNCLNSHSHVSKVILFLGVNDLINGNLTVKSFQPAIKNLIQVCEKQHLAYQLCTLPPCLGYPGMDQAKEAERKEINRWLVGTYRNVWDFAGIVEGEPGHLNPSFDSGDHLHFNAVAGLAIARQISSDFVKGE